MCRGFGFLATAPFDKSPLLPVLLGFSAEIQSLIEQPGSVRIPPALRKLARLSGQKITEAAPAYSQFTFPQCFSW